MASMKTIKIDGKKLKAEIFKRFPSYAAADKDLGFSNALHNWVNRDTMPEYAVYLLAGKWGLSLDDYKPEEKPPVTEQAEDPAQTRKPCHYCQKDECAIFASGMDERLNMAVNIKPGRRIMDAYLTFGNEIVMSENTFIRYCPFCGRELV